MRSNKHHNMVLALAKAHGVRVLFDDTEIVLPAGERIPLPQPVEMLKALNLRPVDLRPAHPTSPRQGRHRR